MKRQQSLSRATSRHTVRRSTSKKRARHVTSRSQLEREIPFWQVILTTILCLYHLRTMPTREDRVMRTLIIIVGMMLMVVVLAAAGAPDVVRTIFQHWPILP